MTATQLPLAFVQRHNNQQLFSDHYLNVALPQRAEWKQRADDARQALQRVNVILASFQPSQNEAQTEKDLVRPVLEALGHTFEVQAPLRTPDGTKKPDYVFYNNQDALNANKNKTLDDTALQGRAFAIGDAKYWERPLDITLKQVSGDQFTNKNPAYQIAFYMQHSGTEWGILTNGRLWRLYHKDTAHKQDRFYEVDLPALAQTGDPEAFVYFYAFFHRSAFEPGPLGLDALLRESAAYARGLSESLKLQVYDALKHVAQGFLDYPANGLGTDAATLRQIYDNSLIVLYRLLFILYAEARELLPMRASQEYRDDYSLSALVREIARRKKTGSTLLPTTARYWPRLKDLFHIIDVGSPPLKVATFNGGLFDPATYAFLDRYTVGDARLMEALDKLARVDEQFVDYRDLAERHLGTIYEGLLEYHLQPISPHHNWTVDLFNDRGERHRTGSYYTPDFVVQYIVDQTLRPILEAATADKTSDADKIAAVLDVNVLDMSMGSGHFPVAAVEYIARYLVDLGVTPGERPTINDERAAEQHAASLVVGPSSLVEPDLNPLAVDLAKLSLWLATTAKGKPLSFLRPFAAEQIKWKLQVNPKDGDTFALVVAYLDARDVAERLDLVTGGDWSDIYAAPRVVAGDQFNLECTLTVCGATRRDVGTVPPPKQGADATKDLYSDAFKRATVKFGVGAHIYRFPTVKAKAKQFGKTWYLTFRAKRELMLLSALLAQRLMAPFPVEIASRV